MHSLSEAALFEAASRLKGATERQAFLDQACQNDSALRARLEALLHAHDEADDFLSENDQDQAGACAHCGTPLRLLGGQSVCPICSSDSGKTVLETTACGTGNETIGQLIGPYKLLEKIGEGGFGVVYMAEQTHPVRRRVALKVIKLGMDTKEVIARFEAERQALAMMEDPNIAKVLDAGTTDSGRPYFVMELVKGMPITQFCNERRLDHRQRLDLFLDVCSAIQHAHQKGVIHRDLKPSNILVTLHGEKALPKIIDFGIAKATHQPLTEKTLFTRYDQFVGTPIYMSPEQAALSGLDIDTRSDIYALGVLLYELLAGAPPFDAATLVRAGYDEMRRIIREDEPPKPSLRLSTMAAEERTTVARDQGTESERVGKLLQGDLDWIVMKAMDKDRGRRYETASGLAQDIRRHLSNEPVVARPPSSLYRFQKAWRRNRLAYSAGTLVILALVAGLSVAAIGLRQARSAERREAQEKANALREAKEAEAARQDAVAQSRERDMNLYLSRVSQAYREVDANRPADALALLEQCPPELRHWEWNYVSSRCYRPQQKLELQHLGTSLQSLIFSPNGRDVAEMTLLNIKLWERASDGFRPHASPFPLSEEGQPVKAEHYGAIQFSPDGSLLAIGSSDRRIRLWEVASASLNRTLEETVSPAGSVVFHPDGQTLASCHEKTGEICIWDATTGAKQAEFRISENHLRPRHLVYSSNGQWLAVAIWKSQSIKILHAQTGEPVSETGRHSTPIGTLFFSPDNQLLCSIDNTTVRLWDVATGREIGTLEGHKSWLYDMAFSPDGTRLATGGTDRSIKIWDWRARRETLSLTGHQDAIYALKFTPDAQLISADKDGVVQLWDASLNPQASHVPTARLSGHTNRIWELTFASDGRLFSCAEDLTGGIWDIHQGQRQESFYGIFDIDVAHDGRHLLTAHGSMSPEKLERHVRVLDTYSLTERRRITTKGEFLTAAFSPDGTSIAGGGFESEDDVPHLYAWDWQNEDAPLPIGPHDSYLADVRFSRNGKHLASAAADGTVKLWDATRLRESQEGRVLWKESAERELLKIAFSPDSLHLATGNGYNEVVILDVETGELVLPPLQGHGDMVICVAYSPNGKLLASAGADNTVRLWNAETGALLETFLGHTSLIHALAFSPDGRFLASGGHDQDILLWQVDLGLGTSGVTRGK